MKVIVKFIPPINWYQPHYFHSFNSLIHFMFIFLDSFCQSYDSI